MMLFIASIADADGSQIAVYCSLFVFVQIVARVVCAMPQRRWGHSFKVHCNSRVPAAATSHSVHIIHPTRAGVAKLLHIRHSQSVRVIIVPEMVGSVVGVYNGKTFNGIEIKPEMVGHYLGDFSITYRPVRHGRPGIGATNSSRFIPLK